jgi:hypothetical protein
MDLHGYKELLILILLGYAVLGVSTYAVWWLITFPARKRQYDEQRKRFDDAHERVSKRIAKANGESGG